MNYSVRRVVHKFLVLLAFSPVAVVQAGTYIPPRFGAFDCAGRNSSHERCLVA